MQLKAKYYLQASAIASNAGFAMGLFVSIPGPRTIALHDQAAEHMAMHPLRLSLVAEHLLCQPWALEVRPSVGASRTTLERVHCADYLDILQASQSLQEGQHFAFDSETRLNQHSWRALEFSAGAWVQATEAAYLLRFVSATPGTTPGMRMPRAFAS